jgi:cytochrome c-type biogenesis protein CcmH/NrfG
MLVTMNCAPEALTLLQSKLDAFDNSAALHHTVGKLLIDQGRPAQGIKELQRASLLASDDITIREHLAMAFFQNHQYREAGELFARLMKLDENSKRSELWIALGECQMQTNRVSDARSSFDTATQLNPTSTTAWLGLAKATLQLGDTRRTEIVLRKAISLEPNSAEAHLLLGYVRVRQSKLPEALVEFRKASALDQKDPVSLCMIGYVLEKTGKPDQAMKYYADALKLRPNDELAARLMASVGE